VPIPHVYLIILVWLSFEALTAVLVAYDARRFGQDPWLWGVIGFLTWPVGPLVWLVIRAIRSTRPR
jgi:hypothetical protein